MKMGKQIYRVVLTGGPASGKTTLISRILKEFKQDDGWGVMFIAHHFFGDHLRLMFWQHSGLHK